MMSTRQRFYLSWTMMVVAAIIVISANTILESWGQLSHPKIVRKLEIVCANMI